MNTNETRFDDLDDLSQENGRMQDDDRDVQDWTGWTQLERELLEAACEFKGHYDATLEQLAKLNAQSLLPTLQKMIADGVDPGPLAKSVQSLVRGVMGSVAYSVTRRRQFQARKRAAVGLDNVVPSKTNPLGLRAHLAALYQKSFDWVNQDEHEQPVTGRCSVKEACPAQLLTAWTRISSVLFPLVQLLQAQAGSFVSEDINYPINGSDRWMCSNQAANLICDKIESSMELLDPTEVWVYVDFDTLLSIYAEVLDSRSVNAQVVKSTGTADPAEYLARFLAKA